MLGLVFTCGEGGVEERDYHSELMSLHQRWTLKKSVNMITGDLTYNAQVSVAIRMQSR